MTISPMLREAIDELRAIRSDDPAAASAIAAVRVTVHTIERAWNSPADSSPDDRR